MWELPGLWERALPAKNRSRARPAPTVSASSHSQCLLPQSVPPLTVRTDSHNGYSCTRGGAVSGRRAYGSTMYTLPRAARLRNSMISM